jgi:ABC-type multidrug transport system ATPase subunit
MFLIKADFLGDRIAIMSNGSLRCCGSPLYLKSKYSSGYNLVLTKKQFEVDETNLQNNNYEMTNKITDLIKSIIPETVLHENLNSEISFVLPALQTSKFSTLFEKLDKNKESLNIDNIGISISTLEDVFMK